MNTFKIITAATTIALGLFAAATQASPGPILQGTELNGVQFNGVQFNGVQFNDFKLNGFVLQGVTLQGVSLQGSSQHGIVMSDSQNGQPVAVSLPGGKIVHVK